METLTKKKLIDKAKVFIEINQPRGILSKHFTAILMADFVLSLNNKKDNKLPEDYSFEIGV